MFCRDFRCLPNPGGMFQQDAQHIWKMRDVYRAYREWENAEIKKIGS